MGIVHLAGNDVTIEGRVIQRCLICGYKLVDVRLDRIMMMSTKEDDNRLPVFSVGHLIEVTEGNPTSYIDLGDTKQPLFDASWDDCCINLVEE